EPEHSMAKPICRHAITSEWSPKMERAWVASVRAATCMQNDVSSPAILYMLGIISSRPCDAVKVVARAPPCSAPCTAPAAPPSDCISLTSGTTPHTLRRPWTAHSSDSSPIGEDGVIGEEAVPSLSRYPTEAGAPVPSTVITCAGGTRPPGGGGCGGAG